MHETVALWFLFRIRVLHLSSVFPLHFQKSKLGIYCLCSSYIQYCAKVSRQTLHSRLFLGCWLPFFLFSARMILHCFNNVDVRALRRPVLFVLHWSSFLRFFLRTRHTILRCAKPSTNSSWVSPCVCQIVLSLIYFLHLTKEMGTDYVL